MSNVVLSVETKISKLKEFKKLVGTLPVSHTNEAEDELMRIHKQISAFLKRYMTEAYDEYHEITHYLIVSITASLALRVEEYPLYKKRVLPFLSEQLDFLAMEKSDKNVNPTSHNFRAGRDIRIGHLGDKALVKGSHNKVDIHIPREEKHVEKGADVTYNSLINFAGNWYIDFGEKKYYTIFGIPGILSGVFLFGSYAYMELSKGSYFQFVQQYQLLIILASILLVLSIVMVALPENSKCKKCKAPFSAEIIKEKIGEDTTFQGQKGNHVEVFKKCRKCGFESSKTFFEPLKKETHLF